MDSNIHNWYEHLLFEKLATYDNVDLDEDAWSDVACVALNHLPPRYVRHSVDMSFYTSPQERQEMDKRIQQAIENAITFVKRHPARRMAG